MTIPLVQVEEMRTARGGGRGKGAGKYAKYITAIQKSVPFLKESIEKKGTIRVKSDDIKKEMGGEFVTRHSTSIYWALKYSLFQEGIWITTGKHVDGSEVLVMREATPEDKLPESLTKGNRQLELSNERSEKVLEKVLPLPDIPDIGEKEDEKDPIDPIDEDEKYMNG